MSHRPKGKSKSKSKRRRMPAREVIPLIIGGLFIATVVALTIVAWPH